MLELVATATTLCMFARAECATGVRSLEKKSFAIDVALSWYGKCRVQIAVAFISGPNGLRDAKLLMYESCKRRSVDRVCAFSPIRVLSL